jgi:hypothetical protein
VWATDPSTYSGTAGPVTIEFAVDGRSDDGVVAGRLVYELAGRSWVQTFAFVAVTVDGVDGEAQDHGLTVVDVHGEDDTWLELRAVPSS